MALASMAALAAVFGSASYVLASPTSSFNQTINAGTLSVDIVDASFVTVGSPSVVLGPVTFSFGCQTSSGVFGTNTQRIYVQNPDAADNGWTVALAASSPTNLWTTAGTPFDFNDPTTGGCTDGGDADSRAGQMSVDPSVGTLNVGQCSSCATTNVTRGSASAFNEGVTNSITILTGAANSDDIGDWRLTGVDIDQTIPGEQPAGSDYSINLTLSVTAS